MPESLCILEIVYIYLLFVSPTVTEECQTLHKYLIECRKQMPELMCA